MKEIQISKTKNIEKTNIAKAGKLIVVIRISGMVGVRRDVSETLDKMRLRRKYSCILLNSNINSIGMLKKVKHYVAYGEIEKNILEKLIKERAESIEGRKKHISSLASEAETAKIANEIFNGKKLSDFGLKQFFRLHPPRKGIKSKLQYPKGVLGFNKDINKLVERML